MLLSTKEPLLILKQTILTIKTHAKQQKTLRRSVSLQRTNKKRYHIKAIKHGFQGPSCSLHCGKYQNDFTKVISKYHLWIVA